MHNIFFATFLLLGGPVSAGSFFFVTLTFRVTYESRVKKNQSFHVIRTAHTILHLFSTTTLVFHYPFLSIPFNHARSHDYTPASSRLRHLLGHFLIALLLPRRDFELLLGDGFDLRVLGVIYKYIYYN